MMMAIVFHQVTKHIGGDFVLASAWNDDVSLNLGGLDEGIVHRFDGRQIAGDCALIGAVPLPYVPFDSSDQVDIRFSIHKYFDVNHGNQLGYGQNQDAFEYDDRLRLDRGRLLRTRLYTEIVDRRLDVLSGTEFNQI